MTGVSEYCDQLVPYLNIPQTWYSTLADKSNTQESHKPSQTLSISFTITPEEVGNADEVNCTLMMNFNYDLLFTFSCKKGTETFYSVNLYWEAVVEDPISTKQPEYEYTNDRKSGSMQIQQTKNVTVV